MGKCYALLRMRPLSISYAEGFVVIFAEKSIMSNLAGEMIVRTLQHLPSLQTRSETRVETKYDAVAGWRRSLQRQLSNGVNLSRECS
jgi:hypothetical protein